MQPKHVVICLAAWWVPSAVLAAEPVAAPLDRRQSFFASQEAHFAYRAEHDAPIDWSMSANGRVLGRGRAAAQAGRVDVRLAMPTVADDAVVELKLTVGGHSRTLHLYPTEAFALRKQWLGRLDITLFDPEGSTADCFDKAGIPYRYTKNIAALDRAEGGLLIVGEGVSFDRHRGLGRTLLDAAARGARVLILCPADANLPLGPPRPARLQCEDEEAIRRLSPALAGDLNMAARFSPKADVDRVVLDCIEEADGWPWVWMEFSATKGRLLLCGVEVVPAWDASPAPRYFLRDVFEMLTLDDP